MARSVTGERFHLKRVTDDYELWYDSVLELDYVTLRDGGLKKIAALYLEKYGIKIETVSKKAEVGVDRDIHANVVRIANKMKNGEVVGLNYIVPKSDNPKFVDHVSPFIIYKDAEGKVTLLNFKESLLDEGKISFDIKEYKIKVCKDHILMQMDSKSCGAFAVFTVKHYLRNLSEVDEIARSDGEDFELSRMVLVQDSMYFKEFLNGEKRHLYTRDKGDMARGESAKSEVVNHKAFYKGHDFLRRILSEKEYTEYEELLGNITKKLILDIDQKRVSAGHKPSPRQAESLVASGQTTVVIN